MNLSEIIKKYRQDYNLTMQELADRCGLSKGYISMLENKFKPTGRKKDIVPSIQAIKKLSNGTGIDFDYLLSSIDGEVSLVPTKDENSTLPKKSITKIPLYTSISCGTGLFVDDQVEDYIAIPDKYIKSGRDYFANTASGDSMIGKGIKKGDVLVFEKTNIIENGEIGAFCVGESEAVCKTFRKLPSGIILLESANEAYQPIEVDITDECFRVIGKYKFKFSIEQ